MGIARTRLPLRRAALALVAVAMGAVTWGVAGAARLGAPATRAGAGAATTASVPADGTDSRPGTMQWHTAGVRHATTLGLLPGPGGTVIVGTVGGDPDDCGLAASVLALDQERGRVVWAYRAKGRFSYHVAGVAAGFTFVYDIDTGDDTSCGGDTTSTLRAVDARGRVHWALRVPATDEPGPAVLGAVGSVVVVAHGNGLTAVDARTGRAVWQREQVAGFLHPTLVDGVVVVDQGDVVGFDARDGREAWRVRDRHFEGTYGGLVFGTDAPKIEPGAPATLTAYVAATGAPAWTADVAVDALGLFVDGFDDVVFVDRPDGTRAGLDLATGHVRPLTDDGSLVAGARCGIVTTTISGGDGSVSRVTVRELGGADRWRSSLGFYALAADDHAVYARVWPRPARAASRGDATVAALDCVTGAEQWRQVLPREGPVEAVLPVPGGVIVATDVAVSRFVA